MPTTNFIPVFGIGRKHHRPHPQGKRVSFKNTDIKVASGVWHTLRVEFKGNSFAVFFDGNKVIAATDDSIANAGKVGVWTKADSVTLFDDFSYGSQ